MEIIELRILPPIAIGRLGESNTPLAAYNLQLSDKHPLDFREVVPQETFRVDRNTGRLSSYIPTSIKFKDVDSLKNKNGKIHPVAPFLEVFAITSDNSDLLVPLTSELLDKAGFSVSDISWRVEVGNIKVFRRTANENDKIYANIENITSHEIKELNGECPNFIDGKTLPLGHAQFIAPCEDYPEIRFRFTPAGGKVYGSSLERHTSPTKTEPDPIITHDDLILYDINKPGAEWRGFSEGPNPDPNYTNPAQIFAGYATKEGAQVSWGYLDDECDGFVEVNLCGLVARAHIGAGPPAFAPDTLPVRAVVDELEQILLSPDVEGEVSIEEAEGLVRRAFETVRLMNTAVMNGNSVNGLENVASTMVRQDTSDFNRLYEPIMATSLVDNLSLRVLHERVFNGLATGTMPWFADALRRPEEIGDLSNEGRRKMPALMRGADGRALTFTHRQINTIIKAAIDSIFTDSVPASNESDAAREATPIEASNLSAQLQYRGKGNPFGVLPRTAISNCFPGLEFDFRNLWRRAFKEILLIENNNYVIGANEGYEHLVHHRLVAIDGKATMVSTSGPTTPNGSSISLKTADNPNGVSFMEWSNNLAQVLQKAGQTITCHFTAEVSQEEVVVDLQDLNNTAKYVAVDLTVNHVFQGDSAALTDEILQPGELTQGLCAPWQNDYRECACYYWAASRPDYVNVEPNQDGLSKGDNWMSKKRSGEYVLDNRTDSRLLSYDDLFKNWQGELNFIIKGNDALEAGGGQV